MPELYSADWFRAVLNAMSEFVLVKGPKSRLVWANQAFLEYYGMTNEQLAGLVDAPHSDPDDTLQYVRDDLTVFETGQRLDVVEPVTDSTGIVGYYDTTKTPLRDSSGHITGIVGTSRSAYGNEAEQSELERQERKEKMADLRALVTNIPMAVALVDVNERVVAVSRAWQRLFASTKGEVGDAYEETYGSLFDLQAVFRQAIRDGEPVTIDNMDCDVPGRGPSTFQVHAEPFQLPNGQVGGLTVLLHDVTDLKRNEAALARANDELTQFNYRVSHDIKAPLRSIIGLTEICREQVTAGTDSILEEALDRLGQSAEQLATLVENLMILARADAEDVQNEECDIAMMVDASLKRHHEEIEKCGIQINRDLEIPKVRTQPVRLSQCLENLVSNAVKYADLDEPERRIDIKSHMVDGRLVISVEDNGLGIEDSVAPKIFDQFFRGSAHQTGNGLGLYIVSKHAARLGGMIEISHNAKPTKFSLSLPLGAQF